MKRGLLGLLLLWWCVTMSVVWASEGLRNLAVEKGGQRRQASGAGDWQCGLCGLALGQSGQ